MSTIDHPSASGVMPGAAIFVNDQGAADLFGISKSHFRKLVSKGELPAGRRLGRRRIWLVAELMRDL